MSKTPNINAAIKQWLTSRPVRAPHPGLHVADVANECPRFVWNRIHKGAKRVWDEVTQCKMEQGFAVEGIVRTALTETLANDWVVVPTETVMVGDVMGHPDIVLQDKTDPTNYHLVEVKSTMWFRRGNAPVRPPTVDELRTSNTNYMIQAAAYAGGVNAKRFTLVVVDRGTGLFQTYEFETDVEYRNYETRLSQMKAALNPAVETPESPPTWTINAKGESYLCKSCPVVACARNPQQAAFRTAVASTGVPS